MSRPEEISIKRHIEIENEELLKRIEPDLLKSSGAKRCFERALRIFEKRLGKDHPNAVIVRNNLKSLPEKK